MEGQGGRLCALGGATRRDLEVGKSNREAETRRPRIAFGAAGVAMTCLDARAPRTGRRPSHLFRLSLFFFFFFFFLVAAAAPPVAASQGSFPIYPHARTNTRHAQVSIYTMTASHFPFCPDIGWACVYVCALYVSLPRC